MNLRDWTYILLIGATWTAFRVASREQKHRPVAHYLAFELGASLIRTLLLPPDRPQTAPPFEGADRILFHVREALFLGSPAALVLLTERNPKFGRMAFLWGCAVLVLVVGYPSLRQDSLRQFYLAPHIAAVLAATVLVLVRWEGSSSPISETCIRLIVAIELVVLLAGPWSKGLFDAWDFARVSYAVLYATLTLLQGGVLWNR